jgi:hypothetical protein
MSRLARTVAGVLVVLVVLAGCGGDDDTPAATSSTTSTTVTEEASTSTSTTAPTTTAPTTTTSTTSTTSTTTTTTTAPATTTAPPTTTAPAPAVGPQTCGTVTSTIGSSVTVEIVVGEVDCAFAESLLDTYYNAPPTPPEGSGAYVTIGDWECNSSATQEPGRASTCHGPDGGLVISR